MGATAALTALVPLLFLLLVLVLVLLQMRTITYLINSIRF